MSNVNARPTGGVLYPRPPVQETIAGLPNGGTAGQVLTKNSSTDQDAGWSDPTGGSSSGGGGALVFLKEVTVAAGASADFTSVIGSQYDDYELVYEGLIPGTNGVQIGVQLSADNGATWITSGYRGAVHNGGLSTSFSNYAQQAAQALLNFAGSFGNTKTSNGKMELYAANTSGAKRAHTRGVYQASDGHVYSNLNGSDYDPATTFNALRVIASSGTITGTFRLYGRAKSGASNGTNASVGGDVLISEQVLTGTAANISFTNIPQGYRDLRVVVRGRGDKAATFADLRMRFNADTGANYDFEADIKHGATDASGGQLGNTSAQIGWLPAASAPASEAGMAECRIADYAGTTYHKAALARSGVKLSLATTDLYTFASSIFWRSAAAITQIDVFPDTGNLLAGSVVSLYGTPVSNAAASVGTHRYWMLQIESTQNNGDNARIGELKFYSVPGGANIATGGTPIYFDQLASSGDNSAAAAYDGNTATGWAAATTAKPNGLGYDFGSPKAVNAFAITARNDAFGPPGGPTRLVVLSSDDNVSWKEEWRVRVTTTWTAGLTQTFTRPS